MMMMMIVKMTVMTSPTGWIINTRIHPILVEPCPVVSIPMPMIRKRTMILPWTVLVYKTRSKKKKKQDLSSEESDDEYVMEESSSDTEEEDLDADIVVDLPSSKRPRGGGGRKRQTSKQPPLRSASTATKPKTPPSNVVVNENENAPQSLQHQSKTEKLNVNQKDDDETVQEEEEEEESKAEFRLLYNNTSHQQRNPQSHERGRHEKFQYWQPRMSIQSKRKRRTFQVAQQTRMTLLDKNRKRHPSMKKVASTYFQQSKKWWWLLKYCKA